MEFCTIHKTSPILHFELYNLHHGFGKDYFAIIRETRPTAVLVETVFIDTASDLAKVSTPDGQAACGAAIAEAVARVRNAKRKTIVAPKPSKRVLHKIQGGAFADRKNAERRLAELHAKGYTDFFIVTTEE